MIYGHFLSFPTHLFILNYLKFHVFNHPPKDVYIKFIKNLPHVLKHGRRSVFCAITHTWTQYERVHHVCQLGLTQLVRSLFYVSSHQSLSYTAKSYRWSTICKFLYKSISAAVGSWQLGVTRKSFQLEFVSCPDASGESNQSSLKLLFVDWISSLCD